MIMKLFAGQETCPHCKTVYRYADLKKLGRQKQTECYHCHKTIRIKRTGIVMLALELLVLYAIVNVLMLTVVTGVSFWALFIVNMAPAVLAAVLLPLYAELKKDK